MTAANHIREVLRADLKTAMIERRADDVSLIRTLIAAIDNAEAVALPQGAKPADSASFASGGAEAARKVLGEGDVAAVLRAEVASRQLAAAEIRQRGNAVEADQLDNEANRVAAYLGHFNEAPLPSPSD
jgi:hypothetical protein